MARRGQQPIDPARREEALKLAEQLGSAAEAGRRLGIPSGTIRRWRSKAGRQVAPPAGVDPERWAQDKRQAAAQASQVASEALVKLREALANDRARDAQSLAIVAGILTDKASALQASADRAEELAAERATRLAQETGEVVVELVATFCRELGIPFHVGAASRRLFAQMLDAAAAGEASMPDELVEEARGELRRRIGRELERELRSRLEPEWRAERRGLPPPGESGEVVEGELLPPRRVVRAGDAGEVARPGEILAPHGVSRSGEAAVPWSRP